MPIIKSAIERVRVNEKAAARNASQMSAMRTAIKKFDKAKLSSLEVTAEEIDETDILSARMNAMQRAIDGLGVRPDFALIDGNRDHGKAGAITTPHTTIVKGDSLSASIAAASVLAKVSRDRYMEEMAKLYPQYAFERHKGYPTKLHYERLRQYGPCPIHRRTFLKKL